MVPKINIFKTFKFLRKGSVHKLFTRETQIVKQHVLFKVTYVQSHFIIWKDLPTYYLRKEIFIRCIINIFITWVSVCKRTHWRACIDFVTNYNF